MLKVNVVLCIKQHLNLILNIFIKIKMGERSCVHHDIDFIDDDHYMFHKLHECLKMLYERNICIFTEVNMDVCRKSFNTRSALVLHCYKRHNIFLCAECSLFFDGEADLEYHVHDPVEHCKI